MATKHQIDPATQISFELPVDSMRPASIEQSIGSQAMAHLGFAEPESLASTAIEAEPISRDRLEAGLEALKALEKEAGVFRFYKGAAKRGSIRQDILKDRTSPFYRDPQALDKAREANFRRVPGYRKGAMAAFGVAAGIPTSRDEKGGVFAINEDQQDDLETQYAFFRLDYATGHNKDDERQQLIQDLETYLTRVP